jgi:exodeoxyribonuclease VII large subunit
MLARVQERLAHHEQVISLTARGALMREPQRYLERAAQQIDSTQQQLEESLRASLDDLRHSLHEREQVLAQFHPVKVLADAAHRIQLAQIRLSHSMEQSLKQRAEEIETKKKVLKLLGPQSVFDRGYTLTTRADGKRVNSKSELKSGDELVTHLADGQVKSRIIGEA